MFPLESGAPLGTAPEAEAKHLLACLGAHKPRDRAGMENFASLNVWEGSDRVSEIVGGKVQLAREILSMRQRAFPGNTLLLKVVSSPSLRYASRDTSEGTEVSVEPVGLGGFPNLSFDSHSDLFSLQPTKSASQLYSEQWLDSKQQSHTHLALRSSKQETTREG